jgi:hypothetical protein
MDLGRRGRGIPPVGFAFDNGADEGSAVAVRPRGSRLATGRRQVNRQAIDLNP